MKRTKHENGKVTWELSAWWDKTIYCFGVYLAVYCVLAFFKGFWGAI